MFTGLVYEESLPNRRLAIAQIDDFMGNGTTRHGMCDDLQMSLIRHQGSDMTDSRLLEVVGGSSAGFILGVFVHTGTPTFGPDTPGYFALVLGFVGAAIGGTIGGLLESPSSRARAVSRWCVVFAIVVGGLGFLAGFVGPILLTPDLPQGPLLGIFVTGPLGTVLWAILGILVGALVPLSSRLFKSMTGLSPPMIASPTRSAL